MNQSTVELQSSLDRLGAAIEELLSRGTATVGDALRGRLELLQRELGTLGLVHLEGRLAVALGALGSARAPALLLELSASLRMLERLLTIEVGRAALATLASPPASEREEA